jgi:hypothetical protein
MKLSKKIWAILAIIIVSTLLLVQAPAVSAGQENVQEKVLNALRDVAGIDVDNYTINVTNYSASPTPDYEKNYRGEEDIRLTLVSEESHLSVIAEYLNNRLIYMYISVLNGSPLDVHYVNKLSDDPLIATQEALYRLQKFTGNPVISDMQKIIESVDNLVDLADKTDGNIKCVVYVDSSIVESNGMYPVSSIYFMYSVDGVESPKSIGVHFENGFFVGFHDAWNLYPIGSETVKVSREQAIAMAREHAIAAAESVSLEFPSDRVVIAELSLEVRDDFALYPFWFVEIPLVYPLDESIYGWQEGIWADTGEVLYGHPVGGYGVMPEISDPSSTQNTVTPLLLYIAGIIATVAVVGLITIVVLKKR